jgi:opacity protein-like surface antigen
MSDEREVCMKRMVAVSVVMIVLLAAAAQAQTTPPPPGPEHKKLGVFLGAWTGDGKAETTPFGKGGATKGTMTCASYAGGYQLVCDSDDSGPTGNIKSHAIYGYNVEKKQYFSFGIDSNGYGGPGTAKVDGSTWTFEGSDTFGGKTYWFRTAVKLVSPTELTYKSEYSDDGKTWKVQAEGKMAKK